MKKSILLTLVILTLIGGGGIVGLYGQTTGGRDTPFFSLGGGIGSSNVLIEGLSFEFIFDPKVSLTPNLLLGSKNIVDVSTDKIISIEAQAFLRWDMFRLDSGARGRSIWNTTNVFLQGGVGLLGAFRDYDVTDSHDARASLLFDATAGVTIPIVTGWYIEPSIRAGYPFQFGVALTAGRKIPLVRRTTEYVDRAYVRTEFVEIIRNIPPSEIVRRILISQVEYIIFAPDISRYNYRVDHDAQSLNELVIEHISRLLRENPDYRVRIEGHANPVSHAPGEID